MHIPLPPPRRRGKHAKPSKTAHAVPAVLLAMPVVSGAGLVSLNDSPASSAASLIAAPAAASTTQPPASAAAPAPAAAAQGARSVNEQRTSDTQRAAARTAQTAAAKAAAAKAAVPVAGKQPAVSAPAGRGDGERASRSSKRTSSWVTPLAGRLTSSYGPRWGRQHGGIDVAAPVGVPIRAAAAGEVILAGWAGGYGQLVRIRHADGTVSGYAHMSRIRVEDTYVRAGEIIGEVGSTGRSTGPHLHFEVRQGDRPLNPITYLRDKGVSI